MERVKRDLTMSMGKIQVIGGILGFIPALIGYIVFLIIWGDKIFTIPQIVGNISIDILISVGLLYVLIYVHEVIHCIGFMFDKNVKRENVKIGFQWKMLTPYAHCDQPIPIRIYRWAVLLPTLILGLVPMAIGLITGHNLFMLYGFLLTCAGGGDMQIILMLRKEKKDVLIKDHPTKAGCEIYE